MGGKVSSLSSSPSDPANPFGHIIPPTTTTTTTTHCHHEVTSWCRQVGDPTSVAKEEEGEEKGDDQFERNNGDGPPYNNKNNVVACAPAYIVSRNGVRDLGGVVAEYFELVARAHDGRPAVMVSASAPLGGDEDTHCVCNPWGEPVPFAPSSSSCLVQSAVLLSPPQDGGCRTTVHLARVRARSHCIAVLSASGVALLSCSSPSVDHSPASLSRDGGVVIFGGGAVWCDGVVTVPEEGGAQFWGVDSVLSLHIDQLAHRVVLAPCDACRAECPFVCPLPPQGKVALLRLRPTTEEPPDDPPVITPSPSHVTAVASNLHIARRSMIEELGCAHGAAEWARVATLLHHPALGVNDYLPWSDGDVIVGTAPILFLAVLGRHVEVVGDLLQRRDVEVNACAVSLHDGARVTPLFMALRNVASQGNGATVAIARMLLQDTRTDVTSGLWVPAADAADLPDHDVPCFIPRGGEEDANTVVAQPPESTSSNDSCGSLHLTPVDQCPTQHCAGTSLLALLRERLNAFL
eukprot:PhM_4_TR4277/c0_g1_i1/m.104888